MTNKELFLAINDICEDRGLEKEKVFQAFGKGLANAYFKTTGIKNVKTVFNEEDNEYYFVEYYTVVEDDELEEGDPSKVTLKEAKKHKKGCKLGDYFEIKRTVNPKDFGRNAIKDAKGIFNQELTKLEREQAFDYFQGLVDRIIQGTVFRIKDKRVYIDLGREVITSLPQSEFTSAISVGSPVKVYVIDVEPGNKGPKVKVSKSNYNMIKKLFEENITEIQDGTVDIKGIAREIGVRTKVCVMSHDPNVDPLGACLGQKGARIQDIINKLDGEKIDLYEWSDDPKILIANALKPAEVIGVHIEDEKSKKAIAVVSDDQYTLAIGKNAQNVTLAVRSCDWNIDIKKPEEAAELGIVIKSATVEDLDMIKERFNS